MGMIQEVTAAGLAKRFAERCRTSPHNPFAFLLGAGASVSKRSECHIKQASKMVEDWVSQLCCDATGIHDPKEAMAWATAETLGITGYDSDDPATSYSAIFQKVYQRDPEEGRRYIQKEIDGKTPDLGYYLLAQVLAEGPSRLVVTTNFDNHAIDALAAMTSQYPLVVGHEILAGYVEERPSRPTIIKLHRDLFFGTKNTEDETATLDDGLAMLMKRLCMAHPFIVVGYGGNDGSLMEVLEELPENAFPAGLWWCWYRHGVKLSDRIQSLLRKQNGLIVPIDGFNELMTLLAGSMDFEVSPEKLIQRRSEQRIDLIGQTFVDLTTASTVPVEPDASPESDELIKSQRELLVRAARTSGGRPRSWWDWVMQAERVTPEERGKVYEEALKELPGSPQLLGSYALFLKNVKHEYDRAEEIYKRAIEADPNHANNLGNYAIFLKEVRLDHDRAEEFYKRAIEADPNHANNLGNYALFLKNVKHEYDRAEEFYKRAIEADPKIANNLGNYANFLIDVRHEHDRAEEFYRRAIEADPNHANNLGNYALFLKNDKQDHDRAEEFYKRAIEADPNNANNLRKYANFLTDVKHEHDLAEEFYRRAIEADPNHANNLGSYAVFLKNVKHEYDRAEEIYKRAIEADPKNANNLGNYAILLKEVRLDHVRAEEYYMRAIEADPNHANNLRNYANFLKEIRLDHDRADEFFKRAIEADPNHANNLGNYALFLKNVKRDHDRAEEFYKRAIEADPKNANNLGNYAIFLKEVRLDHDQAEEFYMRAIEADPNHAKNLGNYANFLTDVRDDLKGAEKFYKRAIEADPRSANNLGNYARALLSVGRLEEGRALLAKAFDMQTGELHPAIQCELAFYGFAFGPNDDRVHRLRDLRRLIEVEGEGTGEWSFDGIVKQAFTHGHPDKEWLPVLADVLAKRQPIHALANWEAWRAAK